jgi:peptidoglycan hydrolase CwlO-like protein
MTQNDKLLLSVSILQEQVLALNNKITIQAEVHQSKLDKTHRVIDEMRNRIMELENVIHKYQTSFDHCSKVGCKSRQP